jgi:ribosomal protein S18 acetylase RimI-like enzyme
MDPMLDLVIRPAVQGDFELLWDFLAMAAYEPDVEAAKAAPSAAKYLVGWQRPGDFGFIAEQNGETIGAAWARRFSAEELRFPYGDEEAPKVSIGVKPNVRGQGVGEKLMRALIGEAARRGLGLCLSVRSENPARRLYERLGFRDIPGSAATNRTGGMSIGMALEGPRVVPQIAEAATRTNAPARGTGASSTSTRSSSATSPPRDP